MNPKLRLAALLVVLLVPVVLFAGEPGPAQPFQAAPAVDAGCGAGQDVMAQILGVPATPPVSSPAETPFDQRQERGIWCGACLDPNYDCSIACGGCTGYVERCLPGCQPLCICEHC